MVGQRQSPAIQQKPHLDNGIGPMLFARTSAPQLIFLVNLKIIIGHVIVGVIVVPAILLFDHLIKPALQVQIEAVVIVQTAVHRLERGCHGFKKLRLVVVGLFLGAGIEQPRIDQQSENGIEIEIDFEPILMPGKEGMDAQLVIQFLKNSVAKVL